MLLEFRLRTNTLANRVLKAFNADEVCAPGTFAVGGAAHVIDHVEITSPPTFHRVPNPYKAVTTQNGGSVVSGAYDVHIHQSVTLFPVGLAELESSGESPTQGSLTPVITLILRIGFGLNEQGSAAYRIEYVDVDLGDLGSFLTAEEAANVVAAIDAVVIPIGTTPWETLPVTDLAQKLQTTLVATNVGVALGGSIDDPGGQVVIFRIELNGPDPTIATWNAFYAADFDGALSAGLDWQVWVDKEIVLSSFNSRIHSQLRQANEEGAFVPSSALPYATWDPSVPKVSVAFSGEVPHACNAVVIAIPIPVDVDVDVIMDISFQIPAPNRLQITGKVYWDANDAEVFVCAVSGLLFWPIVSLWMYVDGKNVHCPGGAPPCLDLGITGTLVTPIGVFIGILTSPGSYKPADLVIDGFQEVDKTDANMEFRQTFDNFELINGMSLTHVGGTESSLQLGGTFVPAAVALHAEHTLGVSTSKFAWAYQDPCESPKLVVSAQIDLHASDGVGIPRICTVSVLDDPANQYKQFLSVGAQSISIEIPAAKVKQAFLNAPYPCKVLIQTSMGARILTIDAFAALSDAEKQKMDMELTKTRIEKCRRWIPIFWGKHFNPRWLIDPPPYERVVEQLWTFAIRDSSAGATLVVKDLRGHELGRSVVDRSGSVWLTLGLPAGTREITAEVGAPANRHSRGTAEAEGRGMLGIYQVALAEETLRIPAARHASLGHHEGRRALFVLTDRALEVFDLRHGTAARKVHEIEAHDYAGFTPFLGGGILWGGRGAHFIAFTDERGGGAVSLEQGVTLATVTAKGHAYLLTETGIKSVSSTLMTRWVPAMGVKHMIATRDHLIAASDRQVFRLCLETPTYPRVVSCADAPRLARLLPYSDIPGMSGSFLVEAECGSAMVRAFGEDGLLEERAAFERTPAVLSGASLGMLRARLNEDGAIALLRAYAGRSLDALELGGPEWPIDPAAPVTSALESRVERRDTARAFELPEKGRAPCCPRCSAARSRARHETGSSAPNPRDASASSAARRSS
ncbi:hypothetical protein WME90_28715 [Sorangium sp. So ce375]|uniref:hypothetical protein n=1 Tax=Sorangium sp. So ce375 TaxID=3133306 RepID=UPI003F5B73B8